MTQAGSFDRAALYAVQAREHRAKAAAAVDTRTRARHQRKAVQLEAAVRSIANVLMYRARYGREASDER